jgi:hypothetical protein
MKTTDPVFYVIAKDHETKKKFEEICKPYNVTLVINRYVEEVVRTGKLNVAPKWP